MQKARHMRMHRLMLERAQERESSTEDDSSDDSMKKTPKPWYYSLPWVSSAGPQASTSVPLLRVSHSSLFTNRPSPALCL